MKKITYFSNLDIKNFIKKLRKSKKILWFLGTHVFFVILVFIILDVLFGGLLFYNYAVLAKMQEPNIADKNFKFEKSIYQEVLGELQAREQKFESASGGNYLSPFQ